MTWLLPRPNPPPPCCCPQPQKIPPLFAEGIAIVLDIDYDGIVVEDIAVVDIEVVGIEQDDTEAALIPLASSHHFSSSRFPLYFLAAAEVLCNIFHRGCYS